MAHWFHRNPLKATAPTNFDLKAVATNAQAQKICSDLRQTRNHLLGILSDPNQDIALLTKALEEYFSLLHGFATSLDDQNPAESKLRGIIRFRWTNTLCGNKASEATDVIYEESSMLYNVALWYTKHAAKIAGRDEPSMDEAKEVHKCLRIAAGLFTYIKDNFVGKLLEQPEKGTDLDTRVIDAYIHQCTAEAQEVTIARAIEMKHASSIVSALANETARMFTLADDALTSLDAKQTEKWRRYLQFKVAIYYAYAYNFHGETLLAEDKCGEAIKCLQESMKNYEKAFTVGKEYGSSKGPGTTAKPHEHLFFRKLGPVVKRTLEKCERENGFIYHHKVPADVPDLELKATYGLVAPEEFSLPRPSPLWTKAAYDSFDVTKAPQQAAQKKPDSKEGENLPPVKEADIPQSNKDPKNSSGCVLS